MCIFISCVTADPFCRLAETLAVLFPKKNEDSRDTMTTSGADAPSDVPPSLSVVRGTVGNAAGGTREVDSVESAESKRERMLKAVDQRNKSAGGSAKSVTKKIGPPRLP